MGTILRLLSPMWRWKNASFQKMRQPRPLEWWTILCWASMGQYELYHTPALHLFMLVAVDTEAKVSNSTALLMLQIALVSVSGCLVIMFLLFAWLDWDFSMFSDGIVVSLMDFNFSLWHLTYKFHVFYYLLSTCSISGINSLETLALMKDVFLILSGQNWPVKDT